MRTFSMCAIGPAAVLLALVGCSRPAGQPAATTQASRPTRVTRAPFGATADGTAVDLFTLTNANGLEARIMTYGATVVSLKTPDKAGRMDDIVLGYPKLDGYLAKSPYFGAIVGRYGNRIAKGKFALDGKTYRLATNDGPNHLHGGVKGFDKVVWSGAAAETDTTASLVLTYLSPAGEEGYPGTLQVKVTYTLTDRNELRVDYLATADAPTPVNLTQHSYFNLTGGTRDILDHQLTLDADRFTPVDATLIPTGEIAPVQGTPFDFRTATAIGARIAQNDVQLKRGKGYDHNWVLSRTAEGLVHAARVTEPTTGRTLDIATTEPGIQFYSGNFLDGTITGKDGKIYQHRFGFCLETQHYPDSPNHANFPSTILSPGHEYRSTTVFAFGVSR